MNKFKISTIILVILLSTLAACSSQAPEDMNQNNGTQSEDINLGAPKPEEEDIEMVEEIEITKITWQWIRFDDTAEINNIVVADPSLYTLTLNADSSYSARVDCNQTQGNYTLDASSLTFEPGITTLAECGPDSLYSSFMEQLSNVAAFVIDGDHLVLNLWADGGSRVFEPIE